VQSPSNPLIEDYTQVFYMIDERDTRIPSIQCKMSLNGTKSARKVDDLRLIFIDFYVPALTPRLNSTETSLQLSENTTHCGMSYTYWCHQQIDLDRQQVFVAYHLYICCTVWGTRRNLVAPHGTDISPSTESLNVL
jgi:hypothetical protein